MTTLQIRVKLKSLLRYPIKNGEQYMITGIAQAGTIRHLEKTVSM